MPDFNPGEKEIYNSVIENPESEKCALQMRISGESHSSVNSSLNAQEWALIENNIFDKQMHKVTFAQNELLSFIISIKLTHAIVV